MKIYSFLGLPASGKGTQAEILSKKIDAIVVGSGDLVRDEIKNCDMSDPFCESIKDRYDKGIPQPNEIMVDLIKKRISNTNKNIILDNYPFNSGQVNDYKKMLSEIKIDKSELVVIEISPKEAIKRVTLRKVCSRCKKIFISNKLDEICDVCGGSLISRVDDNVDVLKTRINKYAPSINEVIHSFPEIGKVHIINGQQSIPDVESEIDNKVLNEAIKKR